jgi:hypothetical protein
VGGHTTLPHPPFQKNRLSFRIWQRVMRNLNFKSKIKIMNKSKPKNNLIFYWIPYLVFLAGSFLYFAFFADYLFFYQEKSSLFIFSCDFLKENLHQPGGFLIWLGKFFSTFYFYPPAGAAILSLILTLIIISVSKTLRVLTGNEYRVIPFAIGATLFFLNANYRFFLFNDLGLLFQLSLFLLNIRYPKFLKGWSYVFLTPICFYFTGGFIWVFMFLATFYFIFDRENKGWIRIIALWCISLLTLYLSMEYLFFESGRTLITFPFTDSNTGSQRILFLAVSGIISILPVLAKIKIRLPEKLKISEFLLSLITSVFVVIMLLIIGLRRFDSKSKQYFYVEKLFYEEKFDEVIAYNTANPPNNSLTIFLNNIALCETDRLDDMLFHFLQSPDGKTLFLKWEMVGEILNRGGYFYYTIGMINEAHRWAFENMVMKGHSPEGLKMLIKTDLINANYEVASRYINILKKTLFYRKEAESLERLLFTDTAFNADERLSIKRKTKIENDFFAITDNPYINIETILASDSSNKKAFEYKMAFMLLQKNFKGIAHELPKFEKFGFTRLPVNVEEAAIALSISNKGRLPEMGNLQISKNTEQKWYQYLSVLKQYNNDVKSAEPALKRRFGDTFWYYVFFK